MTARRIYTLALTAAFLGTATAAMSQGDDVELVRTPNDGIQPRAVVDGDGVLHVVYLGGGEFGDLFYVRKKPGAPSWSTPVRVNSVAGSATLNPAIARAQIALGRHGRIHVAWFNMETSTYWYTHLNAGKTAFLGQRNMVSRHTGGVEAGAALAADLNGNVYYVWHAGDLSSEARRAVYLTRSKDGGKTFSSERRVSAADSGVCGCCAPGATVGREGAVYISYRAAGNNIHRDMTLLKSVDGGQSFSTRVIDKWRLNACPVTITDLAPTPGNGVLIAWAREGRVYFADDSSLSRAIPAASTVSLGRQKNSAIAAGQDGRTLLVWAVREERSSAATLHWQVFETDGRASDQGGELNGPLPVTSVLGAVALPEGRFLVVY